MAGVSRGTDPLTPSERSAQMAKVKAKGNKSTEATVARCLLEQGIDGWTSHPSDVVGRPDFYFPALGLVIFVDGCFWHGCRTCNRNVPRTRTEFWRTKIATNRRRDARVTRQLRSDGMHVVRIWEHQIRSGSWVTPLRRMLSRVGYDWRAALLGAMEHRVVPAGGLVTGNKVC